MNWWTDNLFTMVDVETTSSNPYNAGITSVGLVTFTMKGNELLRKAHFVVRDWDLDLTRSVVHKHTSAWRAINHVDTRERRAVVNGEAFECKNSAHLCDKIKDYFKPCNMDEHIIVANHPEFDISILNRYFYAQNGFDSEAFAETPWRYYNVYDLGSLMKGLGYDKRELLKELGIKTTHCALQDAIDQMLVLQTAYR